MTSPSSTDLLIPARDDAEVRAIGRALIDFGIRDGASLFAPTVRAWDSYSVDELYRCYNQQPDESSDKFLEKLKRQLADASDGAILLTAELLTLQALPLANLKPENKAARVRTVLSWMRQPVDLPNKVTAAFEQNSWNGGTGAHTMLWKWLADAVELLRTRTRTTPAWERQIADDPWRWRDWVREGGAMASLTEALLYLGFPDHFLPIINMEHKRKIATTYASELPGGRAIDDLDRDLLAITVSLQRKHGGQIDFYKPPFVDEWRTSTRPSGERRAWLIRLTPASDTEARRWTGEGSVSVPGAHFGGLSPDADRAAIRRVVENEYGHLDAAQQAALTAEVHAFWTMMRPEDLVVTIFHDQLSAGTVKSPASYTAEPRTGLRRDVGWLTSKPIELASLPRTLRAQLERPGNVVDITGELDGFVQLLSLESETTDDTSAEPSTFDPRTPEALEALSRRVHLETAWLDRQVALVQRRRQIVLYGPPGTGKTYLAQALAEHLTSPDAVRLVQFHPSYSYEDFFEGFRPDKAADGSVGFVLTPGPLRKLVGQARSDPHRPYVLVIDEFNRANLAKVFGELYFLLEYRDHSIRLQYSPEESFSLPPNVYIIGTMNTADRSIARVDAAMRRRFAFVEMHPDEPPVRDLLSRWPGRIENDPRPALLRALNDAIPETDRDFKIGPSYLMDSEAEDDEGLAQVWEHDLLPLLEEHFYGRLSRAQVHQQFGLDAIRQATEATGDDTAPADPESPAP